ncbi:MAG: YtxH domain-containing protein [Clostridia bacterium]|nr:YtxH domain-containing protein [Clostridia bacterium]
MKTFLAGMAAGIVAGGGLLLAVHPMNKRQVKKAYKRAGRMMRKAGCTLYRYSE